MHFKNRNIKIIGTTGRSSIGITFAFAKVGLGDLKVMLAP